MIARTISRTTLVAVLVATTAALVARSWLQIRLVEDGIGQAVATDLSYLVVPPILIFLLFPLWRNEKSFLKSLFRHQDLTWTLALTAIAIGVLIRLLWWSQLIAGASFGFYASADPDAIVGPVISFQCNSPEFVILGFIVMAIFVPLIEEIVYRGYVQTALQRRGFLIAVITSTIVFVVLHRFSSWPFVFFAGFIFGAQYWLSHSLWTSLITHATINGLIQIDWRCLNTIWNPQAESIPFFLPGVISIAVAIMCVVCLALLLRKIATGTDHLSR